LNGNSTVLQAARAMFPQVLKEVACAEAHYRIHSDLNRALSAHSRELIFYHDFFEHTILAHFSGMILSCAHLLDRHDDTASVHWLIGDIERNIEQYGVTDSVVRNLRSQIESLTVHIQKVRRIRNKKVAHVERMTETKSRSFWADVALTNEDMNQLLQGLRTLTTQLEQILWPPEKGMHSFLMIAIDEETSDLIETLKEAFRHGIAPKVGFSPELLPPQTCVPKQACAEKPLASQKRKQKSDRATRSIGPRGKQDVPGF
jgi:hypothetical protein